MATLRSDAEVRQDVLAALQSDVRVESTRLGADVVDGVVTLRGVVSTEFEKRVAADIARRIKGVRDVANELRVVAPRPRPDEQIETDVRAALSRDVWLDERRVTPRVRDGIVYLSGTVETYPAKHGFAVPDNPTYDPAAEARHWAALERLYRARLPCPPV